MYSAGAFFHAGYLSPQEGFGGTGEPSEKTECMVRNEAGVWVQCEDILKEQPSVRPRENTDSKIKNEIEMRQQPAPIGEVLRSSGTKRAVTLDEYRPDERNKVQTLKRFEDVWGGIKVLFPFKSVRSH